MSKPARPQSRNLILVGLVVLTATAAGLGLHLRNQAQQRRVSDCRQQREQIARFRSDSFESQLARMRRLRLNPEQVTTLRRVDPAAYARYARAFGDQVEEVAQAAEKLGALVDAYRAADCLRVE